jgi:hypothetical protein
MGPVGVATTLLAHEDPVALSRSMTGGPGVFFGP